MTRSPLASIVAAASLVVAATCVLASTSGPATAATCGSGSGVTMVVDPGALGGPLTTACDDGEGQAASDRYNDVGVTLSFAQRQPGFVCRVNEVPATEPCINAAPADAYWGLFWSDGTSGTWTYSSIGVTGLKVPEGGSVAFAWQHGTTRRAPAVAAPVQRPATPTSTAAPSPTRQPSPTRSPKPTASSSPGPTGNTASGSPAPTTSNTPAAPSASASPSAQGSEAATEDSSAAGSRTSSPGAKKSAEAADPVESEAVSSAPPSMSTEPVADPVAPSAAETESRRVPTWVSMGILVLLLVSIGVSAIAARRRTQP